jgi:MoaA/NifB/PqqE/SkfB family radical SAM enzyme
MCGMQKRTVAFSKHSSNLFFHILTKCNLRCAHCYINKDQHGTATLDIETIRKWLGIFADKAYKTNLILLGGEPTLHPDLHLAVRAANFLGFKSITIDTNGYLFNDFLDKVSPSDLDFLSFSLDGATASTNDAIRGRGCYEMVLANIENAVAKKFACSMIYTVSAMNIHEIDLMPDLVMGLGITRFFIQVIGLRGRSSDNSGKAQVSRNLWLEKIPEVAEKIAGQGIVVTYPKVFLSNDEEFQCAGLVADNYFVFPNGRVYKCPICEDFPLHSFEIVNNRLVPRPGINETSLFELVIPEGCVMNRMIQPYNIVYDETGKPEYRIACCMLKQEISRSEK